MKIHVLTIANSLIGVNRMCNKNGKRNTPLIIGNLMYVIYLLVKDSITIPDYLRYFTMSIIIIIMIIGLYEMKHDSCTKC